MTAPFAFTLLQSPDTPPDLLLKCPGCGHTLRGEVVSTESGIFCRHCAGGRP